MAQGLLKPGLGQQLGHVPALKGSQSSKVELAASKRK